MVLFAPNVYIIVSLGLLGLLLFWIIYKNREGLENNLYGTEKILVETSKNSTINATEEGVDKQTIENSLKSKDSNTLPIIKTTDDAIEPSPNSFAEGFSNTFAKF